MFTRRTMLGALGAVAMLGASVPAMAQETYVALISKGFQHQFWQAVKAGADKAAAELGVTVTFEGPDTEAQVDRQIDMLAAALAKKPAAIGFAALDSQAAIPLLQQAKDAGIPVVAFDSGVESDIPVSTASTDNIAAAALAADKMAELIGGEGKIALVVHDQTSRTGIDRRDGFVNRMKEAYPKIEIVSIQYGGGDHLQSTEITKSILQANPDLKGIFGANEGSAIGVVNGARELNRQLVIIGYDSGAQQKQAIRDGLMAGAITQNPVGIGYETVVAAVKAAKGEGVEKSIDTGFFYYDKSNIDDPEIAAVLYD
ncbi:ABC transporter substrate-binding protein [Aquamicrobium sp. LC103]|uniref:ABC transporter substrate-binding protein n=1 Tax=Aquamicrobium sp. LC103 TaxID=1120658 RepID=UPI00063EB917|nr:ABC transporter substrate-binding protein [Aquamicrobium sp. LC103]TKT74740.1 substrate-binding domain-containing protein [Aquamicrobium sp. LC103]